MTPLGDPSPDIVNSQYYFVDNKHVDGYQLYNTDAYTSITKNTRGLSVVAIGGSRLVRVDLTDLPIYTQYDPNITETAVSASLSSFTIMDTMRFHFASGFNFTEVENIILGFYKMHSWIYESILGPREFFFGKKQEKNKIFIFKEIISIHNFLQQKKSCFFSFFLTFFFWG